MKIEITKKNGTVYPTWLASQAEKADFKAVLEDDSANRQEFVSAVVKYDDFDTTSIQHGTTKQTGARVQVDSFDDLLAELGKFGI